jgi:glutamine amidotransferase
MDYGVGNLLSLKYALEKVGFNSIIDLSPSELRKADAIFFPGVGNFSTASKKLEPIKEEILESVGDDMPVFGICLGMQLFFSESEEANGRGLAILQGKNVQLPNFVKVPQMGWNTLHIVRQNELFEEINEQSYVYFVHSYYPVPTNTDIVCAETTYGKTFASAVARQNIYGTQFHPEKSGESGLRILRNFVKIVKR